MKGTKICYEVSKAQYKFSNVLFCVFPIILPLKLKRVVLTNKFTCSALPYKKKTRRPSLMYYEDKGWKISDISSFNFYKELDNEEEKSSVTCSNDTTLVIVDSVACDTLEASLISKNGQNP